MASKSHPKNKDSRRRSALKKPWVYVTAVGVAGVISLGTWGLTSHDKTEPVAPEPSAKTIKLSVDSPAYAWATSMSQNSSKDPSDSGGETTTPAADPTRALVPDVTCSVLKTAPDENLYTGDGELKGEEFTMQILAPGTSGKLFSNIVRDSGSCWPKTVEQQEGEGYRYVEAGDGFIAQIGDVLIYTEQSDKSKAMKLFESISATLSESSCIATEVKDSDYTRNKYFSGDEYTGRVAVETVESTLPLDDLPVVTVPELTEIKKPDAQEPEGPLDPSIPSEPDEVTKPSFSGAPDVQKEPFEAEARYQVSDVEGPGCGWGWTSWELPDETAEELESAKTDGIASAQDSANEQANAYLNKQVDWSAGRLTDARDADVWNRYAHELNAASKKWEWLESERKEVKPAWEKYVKDHDYWLNFDQLKEDKKNEYDEAKKNCSQAKTDQEDWDRRYDGTSGNSGGNSGVPERPKGCDEEPKKPAILNEKRPKEPLPPKIKSGVTVPESWSQPK